MAQKVTLTEIVELVSRLTTDEQRLLVEQVETRLRTPFPDDEASYETYAAKVRSWLARCDSVARQHQGKYDVVVELRETREERSELL